MEAEVDAVLARRERVLELVPVAELRLGRDDRLERRLGELPDPHEGVTNLPLLLGELDVVGQVLEAAAAADTEVPARRLDATVARRHELRDDPLREAALHLRHARAHRVAGQPAANEDDEPVVAARRRCRRMRASRCGARAPPPSVPAQPCGQPRRANSGDVPTSRAEQREDEQETDPRDRHPDRASERKAPALGVDDAAEGSGRQVLGDPVQETRPRSTQQRGSTTNIQTRAPTSAPTCECTAPPIAAPSAPARTTATSDRAAPSAMSRPSSGTSRALSQTTATTQGRAERHELQHRARRCTRHELRDDEAANVAARRAASARSCRDGTRW